MLLLCLASGCGAVMCSLTANAVGNCPALKQAAAQSQAQAAPETSSEPEAAPAEAAPAEPAEPAESSESKAPEASPEPKESNPGCRPSGATCDQSYQCCSEACVTHSPDDYCR
nr:hypothetical protein [Kofleriaceae bacterium]